MTNQTAKVSPNYNEVMINDIMSSYQSDPVRATVDALAEKHGKTSRSVIAKLSALGVYVKPAPTAKSVVSVVRKEVFIKQIQEALGVVIPSLDKVNKADLVLLSSALIAERIAQ